MIADAKKGSFGAILVWKLSRFARSRHDSVVYKALLRRSGVEVISYSEPTDATPTGRALEGMIEVFDEFASANQGQDIARGLRENAARGNLNGGAPGCGYKAIKVREGTAVRRKRVIDPEYGSLVRRIFQMAADGNTVREIVVALNEEGTMTPKGGKWAASTVHHILTNEIYLGHSRWRGKVCQNSHDPLVSRQLFQQVQDLLSGNRFENRHPRQVRSVFLLTGLCWCGRCGGTVSGYSSNEKAYRYYVCRGRKSLQTCDLPYVRQADLEGAAFAEIRRVAESPEFLLRLVRESNRALEAQMAVQIKAQAQARRRAADLEQRRNRVLTALETGSLEVGLVNDRLKELSKALQMARSELEQAQAQAVQPITAAEVSQSLLRIDDVVACGTVAERKALIRQVIQRVEVWGDKAQITLQPFCPGRKVRTRPIVQPGCEDRTIDCLHNLWIRLPLRA